MSPPLYFLPGRTYTEVRPTSQLQADVLREHRLDKVLADVPASRVLLSDSHLIGDDGKPIHGCLLRAEPAAGGVGGEFNVNRDRQDWHAVRDASGLAVYWVGFEKDQRPRPADMARVMQVDGITAQLADGQLWKLPLIRRPPGVDEGPLPVTGLPCQVQYDLDGDGATLLVKPRYEALWRTSARAFDVLWNRDSLGPGEKSLLKRFALDCLALNYRVGPAEANVLGLLDTPAVEAVVFAALGVTYFRELESKKN